MQVQRLKAAGFHRSMFSAVVKSLLQKVGCATAQAQTEKGRSEVVPYIHKVTHNPKKGTSQHCVPLVLAEPSKLAKAFPRITASHARQPKDCARKHAQPCTKYATNAVYEIA